MRDFLRKLLKEYEEENAFTKKEALFFKFLNNYRKASDATSSKLGDFMLRNMKSFGLDPSEHSHYLNLYTQNYREDGRYDLTNKSDLKQYHKIKSQRTSNQRAGDLVAELKPFKGSNLKAQWEQDNKGDWAYVVYSWDWYPVFMYKYRRWFEVDNKYSASTSKQMSQSNPRRYNNSIGKTMIVVSSTEMKNLLNGNESVDKVITNKNEKFVTTIEKELNQFKQVRLGWDPRVRVSFNFTNVDIEDGNPVVSVSIVKVDKMNGLKIDKESGNFFRNEMIGVTREYVTDQMKDYVSRYSSALLGRDVSREIVVDASYLDNPYIN
jgi:hypothetical protein